jgi:hypothetical protein
MFCGGLDDEISTMAQINRGPRQACIDPAICTRTPQGGHLADPRLKRNP